MKRSSIIASLLLTALTLSACGGQGSANKTTDAAPLVVKTLRIARAEVPRLCEVPGTVTPRDQSLVSARVMGSIAVADFAIGQRVKQGQLLVVLSAPEMAARVDQAQAELDMAKRDYERESGLLKSGASTEQTVRDLSERLRIAKAGLVEAQSLNSYTRITAPFDGHITRKMASVGDFAAPGTPLFEIAGESGLRVESSVPDSFPELPLGTVLTVRDGSDDYDGILSETSTAADPLSRTRQAKIDLKDGSPLRSGQFVRVLWKIGNIRELVVPKSSVSRFGQIQRVYVAEQGRAHLRIVKTGEEYGDNVQILSGMDEGDIVIVNPPAGIENGSLVEVEQ